LKNILKTMKAILHIWILELNCKQYKKKKIKNKGVINESRYSWNNIYNLV
jgi:hypothetical protein